MMQLNLAASTAATNPKGASLSARGKLLRFAALTMLALAFALSLATPSAFADDVDPGADTLDLGSTLQSDMTINSGATVRVESDFSLPTGGSLTVKSGGTFAMEGGFTVTAGDEDLTYGEDFTYEAPAAGETPVLTLRSDKALTVANIDQATATNHTIVVGQPAGECVANLTLNGVNIESTLSSPLAAAENTTLNLTLAEGSVNTLTAPLHHAAVLVPAVAELAVGGTGSLTATGGEWASGIGGSSDGEDILDSKSGIVVINSGTVIANGGTSAAGIGSSKGGVVVDITINGGNVTANGGLGAAGIGGGSNGDCSIITISGGTVIANGGEWAAGIGSGNGGACSAVTISGGDVTALSGGNGAGIGSGYNGNCDTITISGSAVVRAQGGQSGAGIGSGYNGSRGDITISGGTVIANGGVYLNGVNGGAGIGGGGNAAGGTITISGGTVTATGAQFAAGIGGSGAAGGDIAISGGNVTTTGGIGGAGIGGGKSGVGGTIAISGSAVVNATGGKKAAGIGGGNYAAGGTVTVSENAFVTANGGEDAPTGIGSGCGFNGDTPDQGTFASTGNAVVIASGIGNTDYMTNAATSGLILTPNTNGAAYNGTNGNGYWFGDTFPLTNNVTVPENYTLTLNEAQTVPTTQGAQLTIAVGGVFAMEHGFFLTSNEALTYGADFTYAESESVYLLNFRSSKAMTVANVDQTTATSHVMQTDGSNAINLTLDGVNVSAASGSPSPLALGMGDVLNLTLAEGSENVFDASAAYVGVNAPSESTLTIGGTGSLTAKGGFNGAGIGAFGGAGGNVIINSGEVTASGGQSGAGIGGNVIINSGKVTASGGFTAAGMRGNITINGGEVTATGGQSGAGMSGIVLISGGKVDAKGGNFAAGIGGGINGAGSDVTISGGVVTAIGGADSYGFVSGVCVGIGAGVDGTDHGSFTTTAVGVVPTSLDGVSLMAAPLPNPDTAPKGTAFIVASGIGDQSDKANWSGVIITPNTGNAAYDGKNGNGLLYGESFALSQNAIIPDNYTLTLKEGQSLTVAADATLTVKQNGRLIVEKPSEGTLASYQGTAITGATLETIKPAPTPTPKPNKPSTGGATVTTPTVVATPAPDAPKSPATGETNVFAWIVAWFAQI